MRRLLADGRLAALIVAAALFMKLLIPAGYMVAVDHGRLGIELCGAPVPADHAAMAVHDGGAEHKGGKREHPKPEPTCAFAGLSAQGLASADPALLVGLILFIMAAAFLPLAPPAVRDAPRLRPPLRGPPALF